MKVIGMTEERGGLYICTVSHDELEKLTDQYYGLMNRLKVGAEMNLGAGYDFRGDIRSACNGMVDANQNFDRAKSTLHKFAVMVASLPNEPEAESTETA